MKSFRFLFYVLLAAIVYSCSTADDFITMRYQMTQCADPWMVDGGYFSDKEGTLKSFLENKGVEVESLRITENCSDSAACNACICLGCDLAEVKINAEDEAILKELGFIRN